MQQQQFSHSVKVPRHYKLAANILRSALTEGANVKSLVFDDKHKHFRTNVLYALVMEAIKHNVEIDKLFESTEILKNEVRLDPWLTKILAVELLFGKKSLPGKSKPELTVMTYKERFEKYTSENPEEITKKGVPRPRYVRINTNLLTTSDAIRAFQDDEYRFVRCTSGSYNNYLEQVMNLGQYDFMQDYHVKTVFVFAPGTKLHEHQLYLESKIILQDKATTMAVHLLAPPPGSVVMDMCAAPGMKTTQLAAYMKNQGTIYAVERNAERYKTLCAFVEKTGSTCVKTINQDVGEIKKGDYPDVEYVLLDPSCSGSGMDLWAHNSVDDIRLARLSSLQEKFLKHAMHVFPKVKRIVYSTCSLFSQENERVVTNVINQNRVKWNVLNVKELLNEQWNNFGTGMYGSIGTRCMYARPDSDLTTGFFVAVMDKDLKYLVHTEGKGGELVNKNNVIGRKKEKMNKADVIEIDYIASDFINYGHKIVANTEDGNVPKRKKDKIKKNKSNMDPKYLVHTEDKDGELVNKNNVNDREKEKRNRKACEIIELDYIGSDFINYEHEIVANNEGGNVHKRNKDKKKKSKTNSDESMTMEKEDTNNETKETFQNVSANSSKKKNKKRKNKDEVSTNEILSQTKKYKSYANEGDAEYTREVEAEVHILENHDVDFTEAEPVPKNKKKRIYKKEKTEKENPDVFDTLPGEPAQQKKKKGKVTA